MRKIMIIHHCGNIGGAGVSVFNTIKSLESEYEIVIYCPSAPNDFSDYLNENGINVKTYDFPIGLINYYSGGPLVCSPVFLKCIFRIINNWKFWEKILEYEKPDLVLVNSKTLAWTSLLLKKRKQKSLCHVRETRKKGIINFWNNIQKKFLEKFSGVIFISEYDKKNEYLEKTKSKVVPNFLDLNSYKQKKTREEVSEYFGINSNSFNILFVGGMLRIKGYDVAVKSLKYIKDMNVKLIVAGDSEFHYKQENDIYSKVYNLLRKRYENMIIKEISNYNLQCQIIKIGTQKNMADVYTLADVLIFPANAPHQARPVFEAGVQKIPVLMPDFPNTLEYVSHGDNGLIFKRKDPKSLANTIQILINNKEYRRALGEKNYIYTLKQHTKEKSEKLMKEMIMSILEN